MRIQVPVLRELESTIVAFGRFRKYFDDQGGIERRIFLIVGEPSFSTNFHDLGIRVQAVGRDSPPGLTGGYCAGRLLERLEQRSRSIRDDPGVTVCASRHPVHLALEVSTLELGGSLHRKILLGCHAW